MARAPKKCPVCGSKEFIKVDKDKKGFSMGKAVTGSILLGPVGLLAGGLGKKQVTMFCKECNFAHDYRG